MKYEINELYPSARHAYIAIGLAVKTSRPHNVKERWFTKRIAKLGKIRLVLDFIGRGICLSLQFHVIWSKFYTKSHLCISE